MTALQIAPSNYFSPAQLAQLNTNKMPRHVAIIMDGNRRWAKQRRLTAVKGLATGHWAGAKVLLDVVKSAKDLGIQALTVYAFSTENWSRSETEIEALMKIFEIYLRENRTSMVENEVRLHTIGNLDPVPSRVKEEIEITKEATKDCKGIDLIIAINYGGRDDLRRAFISLSNDLLSKKIAIEEVTENTISRYLDTSPWSDPDLLIRTSGEMRISNFMLWQLSYTEIHVTDILWPDFSPQDLYMAVLEYQRREKRSGL